jgi:hypothetical protein
MKISRLILSITLVAALSSQSVSAQPKLALGDNAALRYWSAFAQMQDSAITEQQAKELNAILDGSAPYDDAKYQDLVEKNRPALETMTRATSLTKCDWGLDYRLGGDAPVDYVRKALSLGRLNVLYAFRLSTAGDKDGAVRALATGFRFSADVANGGSLFAAAVAKTLLVAHIRGLTSALRTGDLSASQRLVLQNAIAGLRPDGLDWQSAVKRDMEALSRHYSGDKETSLALTRIVPAYVGAINNASMLQKLQQIIASVPQPLQDVIPNPKRVLDERQDLSAKLQQLRSSLQ